MLKDVWWNIRWVDTTWSSKMSEQNCLIQIIFFLLVKEWVAMPLLMHVNWVPKLARVCWLTELCKHTWACWLRKSTCKLLEVHTLILNNSILSNSFLWRRSVYGFVQCACSVSWSIFGNRRLYTLASPRVSTVTKEVALFRIYNMMSTVAFVSTHCTASAVLY